MEFVGNRWRGPKRVGSMRAGRPLASSGPAPAAGRPDGKEPSHPARGSVSTGAQKAAAGVERLTDHGVAITPAGTAGVAAPAHTRDHRGPMGRSGDSRVPAFVSEGPEDTA